MWRWDDDGFPLLGEDEEVVLPEEPIEEVVVPPPPPPRIRTRYQAWCDMGIPEDIALAQERKARRQRRKTNVWISVTGRVTEATAKVIYEIVDEYDVPVAQVVKRLIEDGLRSFAKQTKRPELIERAQLKQNPFDEIPGSVPPPPPPTYQPPPAYVPLPQFPPAATLDPGLLPSGAPLTRDTMPNES